MERYFAYGSNLEQRRMSSRCPSARLIGKATLMGYRLDFPLADKNWQGGVAGVLRDEKAQVEGVVYELTPGDLRALDQFEDVALGDYFREERELQLSDGTSVTAWVYFPGQDGQHLYSPSDTYKTALIKGATEHGLTKEYIRSLKSIHTSPKSSGKR